MKKLQLALLFLLCSLAVCAQQGFESSTKKEVYKDTLGNVMTADTFTALTKSGVYVFMYETYGNNVTYTLVNKKKALQESMEHLEKFRKGLINTPLPNFTLRKIDGTEIKLTSLKGKTVVLNYWFIGCKSCVQEMPLLNDVVNHYKSKSDILFLAPALDDREKLIQFFGTHAFSNPVTHTFYYQVLSSSEEFANRMSISSFPTHIIVDSKGIIKEAFMGSREDINKLLIEAIDKIISQ